jgi:glycosyltransferase involved in cell wall biosynthesis
MNAINYRDGLNTTTLFSKVTVGMPVFNGERFVAQAIDSALSQTFTDIELLISDNASTDGTADICRGYAVRDCRVRYIRQESNLGPFNNLKYVTDHASSPFLVWLAHDDVLDAAYIEECHEVLTKNGRTVLVTSDFRIIDEAGELIKTERLAGIRESIPWEQRSTEFFKYPILSNVFYCFYGMVRTNVCRSVFEQLREPQYMSQIELPVLARLAAAGEIFSFPRVLRDYRRVSTSLYHSELNSISEKTRIERIFVTTTRAVKLILDQIAVMLGSSMSWRTKTRIVGRLIRYYVSNFVVILSKTLS